jgi:hypothetical protein
MSNRKKLRGRDWEEASRLVRSLHPYAEQFAAQAEAAVPGHTDQLLAAAAEGGQFSDELARRAKEQIPGYFREAAPGKLPQQLADQIYGLYIRVAAEMATGERRSCPHVSLKTPRACVAPVYADWIRCVDCFKKGPNPPIQLTEREEHTCDLCGGYEPGQTIHELMQQVGPIMLIIGGCPACYARAAPADPGPAASPAKTPGAEKGL